MDDSTKVPHVLRSQLENEQYNFLFPHETPIETGELKDQAVQLGPNRAQRRAAKHHRRH